MSSVTRFTIRSHGHAAPPSQSPVKKPHLFAVHSEKKPITTEMLFHIHAEGDSFGSNSRYEGTHSFLTVSYLASFLEERQRRGLSLYGLDRDILRELKEAVNLKAGYEAFCTQIEEACRTGKPILILGGWTAHPPNGHAVYYEYFPKNQTLHFYDLSDGIDFSPGLKVEGKEKAPLYVEWKNISKEKLLNPHVFKDMAELDSHIVQPSDPNILTEYQAEDIYSSLRKAFGNPEVSICQEEDLWMGVQKTGICPWKSLLAFMRAHIQDSEEYAHFVDEVRIQSLVDAIEQPLDFTKREDAARWNLIRKSLTQLCRSLHYRRFSIDYASAHRHLVPVKKWVKANKAIWKEIKHSLKKPSSQTSKTAHPIAPLPASALSEQMRLKSVATASQPWLFFAGFIKKRMDIPPVEALSILKEINTYGETCWKQKQYLDLYTGLIDWITAFSLDIEFWKTVYQQKPEAAKELIGEFGKLAHLFFKTALMQPQAEKIHVERPYALAKILFVQDKLLHLMEPEKTESLGMGMHGFGFPFDFSSFSIFSTFVHSKQKKDLEIVTKWSKLGYRCLHARMNGPFIHPFENRDYWSLRFRKEAHEEDYFCYLIENVLPELFTKLVEQDPSAKDWHPMEKAAKLYQSDLLPDWVRAIRDTHIYFVHSTHEPLDSPDRGDKEFRIDLTETSRNHGEIELKVSIPGISFARLKDIHDANTRERAAVRFHRQHRPFASSQMREFVQFLIATSLTDRSEKKITTYQNHLKMADEEFKELAHLFASEELQVIELLAYFSKYPDKLKDPDYQTLFELALFHPTANKGELGRQLARFIQRYFERFSAENEIQVSVFLLRISRYLADVYPDESFFQKSSSLVQELLESQLADKEDPSLRSLLYQEWICHLGKQEKLTDEEVVKLVIANVYVHEHPILRKWIDPEAEKEMRQVLLRHARAVAHALSSDLSRLDQIMAMLRPDEKAQKWTVQQEEGCFPLFKTEDGKHLLFPLQGSLVSPKARVILPLDIQEDASFRRLFPTIRHALFHEGAIYSFIDPQGRKTFVKWENEELRIEQQRGDEWFCYVPKSPLQARYLAEQHAHWRLMTDSSKMILTSLKTKEICYEVALQEILSKPIVTKISNLEGGVLDLDSDSSLLSHFEDPDFIEEWKYHNHSKFRLPRFALSFSSKGGFLECDQHKEYVLKDAKQRISELGNYEHALVLDSKKEGGSRRILLPYFKIEKSSQKEVLLPQFEIDRQTEPHQGGDQRYFVFDMQKDGTLFSSSLEANFYLSYVITLCQSYKKGAHYLKKYGEKLGEYSEREISVLEQIMDSEAITGDMSGNGLAFRTYAGMLLLKNALMHKRQLSSQRLGSLAQQYKGYLDHRRNVTELILNREDELLLLDLLPLSYPERRNQLQGKSSPIESISPKKELDSSKDSQKQLKQELEKVFADSKFVETAFPEASLTLFLQTRSYQFMKQYLWVAIVWAQTGVQTEWLRHASIFLEDSKDAKARAVGSLIRFILENPEELSPLSEERSNRWGGENPSLQRWKKTAVEKVVAAYKPQEKSEPVKWPQQRVGSFAPKKKEAPRRKVGPLSYSIFQPASFASQLEGKIFEESPDVSLQQAAKDRHQWLSTKSFEEPVEQKELQRVLDDLEYFYQQPPPTQFTSIEQGLKKIAEASSPSVQEAHFQHLEEEILSLANRPFEEEEKQARFEIAKEAGFLPKLKFDELLFNFAKNSPELLVDRNPALSDKDLAALYQKIGAYLQLATQEQQKARIRTLVEKVNSADAFSKSSWDQKLAEEVLAQHEYKFSEHPEFLVFEYYGDLLLRKKQCDMIEEYVNSEITQQNLISELIMGSGKSKVILPLLTALRARKKRAEGLQKKLSLILVTEAQYETTASDTQKAQRDRMGIALHSLAFDRNTVFTKESLSFLLRHLESIRDREEPLIMTDKSVHNLILKFLEKVDEWYAKGAIIPEERRLLVEILSVLREANVLADEIDTMARVIQITCFDGKVKHAVKDHEIQIIGELYELLYADPDLKTLASLESDPQPDLKARPLTQQTYIEKMKKLLAEKFLSKLQAIPFAEASLKQSAEKFLKILEKDSKAQELALAYLTQDPKRIVEAQQFYDECEKETQEILALAGEEISAFFPHTLVQLWNAKYGIDLEKKENLALPFSAAYTPIYGSQFANQHITMDYTFQTYMKQGIARSQLTDYLQDLRSQALKEMQEAETHLQLFQTEAWSHFRKLPGVGNLPLFNMQEHHVDALLEAINSSIASKRAFISQVILPHLQVAEQTLNFTPHDLFLFFIGKGSFTAVTGTLWNGESMNKKAKLVPTKGTDAKTLSIAFAKSRDKIISIKTGTTQEMLDQLSDCDVLIDGGGYFKQGTSRDTAQALLAKNNKPVLFYNEKGEQRIITPKEEMPFSAFEGKPEERQTFLAQSYTIASDTKEKPNAKGLDTVSVHVLLRDLLQNFWRLREIDKSQRFECILSEEVQQVIREALKKNPTDPLLFDDIFLFSLKNQAKQQGIDNEIAFGQELWGEVKKILLDVLLNREATEEQCQAALSKLGPLWFTANPLTARELYGQIAVKQPSDSVVKKESKKCKEFIKDLFKELPFLEILGISKLQLFKEVKITKKRMLQNLLPQQIVAKKRNIDQSVSIQVQTQIQAQQQKEVEEKREKGAMALGILSPSQLGASIELKPSKFPTQEAMPESRYSDNRILPYFPLKNYILKFDQDLKDFSQAFQDIDLTLNVLQWPQDEPYLNQLKLLGPYQTPVQHLLIQEDRVIMLSQLEAASFIREGKRLYNLYLGYPDGKELDDEILAKVVKVKFLQGESFYNAQERKLLKKWIIEQGSAKMKNFFEEKILDSFPLKKASYLNSVLKKIFRSLA